MGENIPGGNFLDGNYLGGWEFSGLEFSWYPFRFVYKSFIKCAFCLLRHLDFLPAFILKTLGFQYKHQVIFGRSVSCSLLYSVSFFYIYLLLKSSFHFFFGSNLKKILWECNYLEMPCRTIVIPKWAMSLKKLCKRV